MKTVANPFAEYDAPSARANIVSSLPNASAGIASTSTIEVKDVSDSEIEGSSRADQE